MLKNIDYANIEFHHTCIETGTAAYKTSKLMEDFTVQLSESYTIDLIKNTLSFKRIEITFSGCHFQFRSAQHEKWFPRQKRVSQAKIISNKWWNDPVSILS